MPNNTHRDESWKPGDAADESLRLGETIPARFALTGTRVIRNPTGQKVLLIDPHPSGTWNTWMFPYASFVIDETKFTDTDGRPLKRPSANSTLLDLATFLDNLADKFRHEYHSALRDGVNNALPEIEFDDWPDTAYLKTYSLKFSNTSQGYTAYRFEYVVSSATEADVRIPFVWASIPEILDAGATQPLAGKKISSNVVEVAAELKI